MCQCISNSCSGCGGKDGYSCWGDYDCTGDYGGGGYGNNPPSGPPSCFQAGTSITTTDGIKSIEDIKVGDKVKSYDIKNKNITDSEVYETFEHKDISDGLLLNGIIKTTTNHPFYSNGEWVEAGNLKIGDKILHVDGEEHIVNSIEPLNYSTTVYNFEVKDTHNYFAEGYLVHNKDMDDGEGRVIIQQDDKPQMGVGPGLGRRRRPFRNMSMSRRQSLPQRQWNRGMGHTPDPTYRTGGRTTMMNNRLRDPSPPCSCHGAGGPGGPLGHCQGNCVNEFASCGWKQSFSSSGNTYHWEWDGCTSANYVPNPPMPGPTPRRMINPQGKPLQTGGYICPDGFTDTDEFGNNIC